jgi:hypothetical protein
MKLPADASPGQSFHVQLQGPSGGSMPPVDSVLEVRTPVTQPRKDSSPASATPQLDRLMVSLTGAQVSAAGLRLVRAATGATLFEFSYQQVLGWMLAAPHATSVVIQAERAPNKHGEITLAATGPDNTRTVRANACRRVGQLLLRPAVLQDGLAHGGAMQMRCVPPIRAIGSVSRELRSQRRCTVLHTSVARRSQSTATAMIHWDSLHARDALDAFAKAVSWEPATPTTCTG